MQTGAKCKSSDDMELTRDNGEKVFSDIYPSKVDMRGKSKLKQLVAEQMLTVVSTDVSVRFESRCAKLCRSVGDLSKKSACRVVRSAFSGNWEDVPASCESPLKRVLPDDPLKGNTFYDIKARPERKKVDSKINKFQFHHEMTTDGEAVSLLYSREVYVNPL